MGYVRAPETGDSYVMGKAGSDGEVSGQGKKPGIRGGDRKGQSTGEVSTISQRSCHGREN